MKNRSTIDSLQAGRGLAALAVVLLHASIAAKAFAGWATGFAVLQYGYLGVDFFFVLSGFIIFHSTVDRHRIPAEYAIARFRRVYLPYWPIGIAMAAAYTLLPSLSAGNHAWSWLPTLTLAPVDSHPALSVAWTLQHEILFYLLFGIFYFSGLLWLGLAAWAICILGIGHHLPFEAVNLEFFMGIAAAMAYRAKRAPWPLLLLALLPLLVWVALGADEAHRAWTGAMFALIVAPLAQFEQRGLRVPRTLVLLGSESYSLYLIHDPLISASARVLHQGWLIILSSLILSLAAGFAYHFAVERRAIRKRSNPEVFAGEGEGKA